MSFANQLGRAFVSRLSATEEILFVEEQVARGGTVLYSQGGQSFTVTVLAQHCLKVNVAEDVDVVEQEWLAKAAATRQEVGSLFQAATGVEENFFAGNLEAHIEVAIGGEVARYLIGEVVDINDYVDDAAGFETKKREFEEGVPGDFNQRLGTIVRERTKSRAQAGCEDHPLQDATFSGKFFSISTCRTRTSTPSRVRRCCANCSARKTERCCPPVQPKETMRLANPRLR